MFTIVLFYNFYYIYKKKKNDNSRILNYSFIVCERFIIFFSKEDILVFVCQNNIFDTRSLRFSTVGVFFEFIKTFQILNIDLNIYVLCTYFRWVLNYSVCYSIRSLKYCVYKRKRTKRINLFPYFQIRIKRAQQYIETDFCCAKCLFFIFIIIFTVEWLL